MHALAVFALVDWLLTEAAGAWLLIQRIAEGGSRVIFVHAGLAFAGLLTWISFVATWVPALAWTALGLLALAIVLGICAITVQPQFDGLLEISSDETLTRVLEDEMLTTKLIDDLVETVLAESAPRRPRVRLRPLIATAHGLLALCTMLFAVLGAVSAH